ncbi:uncharacterized protein LACBIDRAFT_319120 [Laccaria bicolor S238N-H82]|uniref:Predicted protein n=1 Tax=Laccaria bicolor (strain S238N-H82 / ATCC MYA-4686) TaxID=486041 RepID=B0D7X4_LACBS|nr:uncharacterized protein LACBIDRAFT_319120 [Laccaria bicolor S238N-H82]EDR09481.1 predicted protein [Laccaria bicolor S238N-H82]|eukprot:XP_001879830.1 predicted protein [Laccaria bicolor S238N-H82]
MRNGAGRAGALAHSLSLSHVAICQVPVKITWDSRDDGASAHMHFVDSGRMDFKLISTISRG